MGRGQVISRSAPLCRSHHDGRTAPNGLRVEHHQASPGTYRLVTGCSWHAKCGSVRRATDTISRGLELARLLRVTVRVAGSGISARLAKCGRLICRRRRMPRTLALPKCMVSVRRSFQNQPQGPARRMFRPAMNTNFRITSKWTFCNKSTGH